MTGKQIDHLNYPKRLRSKPVEALRFIVRDAREAVEALGREHSNVGYYLDEISYCAMELRHRDQGVQPGAATQVDGVSGSQQRRKEGLR